MNNIESVKKCIGLISITEDDNGRSPNGALEQFESFDTYISPLSYGEVITIGKPSPTM